MLKENGLQLARNLRDPDLFIFSRMVSILPGRTHIGPVLNPFVLWDQGLMCIEIEVLTPSKVATTSWIRMSRGVTLLARQSSAFAPEIEGTDFF